MNPTERPLVLFVVQSDPRTSHRPAEAIRVAAGIGTWRKADVRLCLLGPAVRALGEWVDDLVDEDNFTRYLPILRDLGHPVLVESGAMEAADVVEPTMPVEALEPGVLAGWCARARSVLRF